MKVYQRLARAFAGEGVTTVFGMTGTANLHWADELDKIGVKFMQVRHEGVGMGMADGWARSTHTTGVVSATEGPGVAQLATGLLTANRASSPVVAFVGECGTDDYENAQYMDQSRFAAACETGFVRLDSAAVADDSVRKAFYLAKLEQRPIMLSAPLDIQKLEWDGDEPYIPSSQLFPSFKAVPPDAESLEQAARMIEGSRKVVIVVGRGAYWAGAGDAVRKLAIRTGALIATTLRAKNWLGDDDYHVGISGNYGTRTAIKLFEEADCVLAVGATMNRYTTTGGYLYPDARIIHINSKPHVMMGGGRHADIYMQADAKVALEAIEGVLARRSVQITGYRTAEVKAALVHNYADPAEFEIPPGTVDPREVCRLIDELVPADIGLGTAGSTCAGFTNMHFNKPRPYVLAAHYFACVGQMVPAVMGAIVASGNKPAMVIDGDAATMMHIGDFETAVRYKIPLLSVVLNDQGLGGEYHQLKRYKLNAENATIPTPDIGAVAKSMGGKGCLARSLQEVRAAVTEWVANPCPTMIDVRITRNVLTLHNRRVYFAKDV